MGNLYQRIKTKCQISRINYKILNICGDINKIRRAYNHIEDGRHEFVPMNPDLSMRLVVQTMGLLDVEEDLKAEGKHLTAERKKLESKLYDLTHKKEK